MTEKMSSKLQNAARELGEALGVKGARLHIRVEAICDHGTLASMFVALNGPECDALFQCEVPGIRARPGALMETQAPRLAAADKFAAAVMGVLQTPLDKPTEDKK